VVRNARQQHVAQQARAIDAQVKQGNCARARELAAAAKQVVPDDGSLEARARACKPRPVPAPQPPAPTQPAPTQPAPTQPAPTQLPPTQPPQPPTVAGATQALQRGDFVHALDLAERVLDADPRNGAATRIAALAACSARDAARATRHAARLPAAGRSEVRDLCDRNGIELDGAEPDERPDDRPDAKQADDDLTRAMRAASAGQWEQALSHAETVLQRMPRNLRALSIGVQSACHLKRDSVARSLLRRLPGPRQRAMRQLCAREGVLL